MGQRLCDRLRDVSDDALLGNRLESRWRVLQTLVEQMLAAGAALHRYRTGYHEAYPMLRARADSGKPDHPSRMYGADQHSAIIESVDRLAARNAPSSIAR